MRFPKCGMCDQQRLRPACAYMQSDQSLCLLLEYSMTLKLLNEHNLEFQSLKGGCTGSSESTLVKMPHCWKTHVTTQMFFMSNYDPMICTCDIYLFIATDGNRTSEATSDNQEKAGHPQRGSQEFLTRTRQSVSRERLQVT